MGYARGLVRYDTQNGLQQHLGRVGVPVSNLKVRINESDPRQTQTRVK